MSCLPSPMHGKVLGGRASVEGSAVGSSGVPGKPQAAFLRHRPGHVLRSRGPAALAPDVLCARGTFIPDSSSASPCLADFLCSVQMLGLLKNLEAPQEDRGLSSHVCIFYLTSSLVATGCAAETGFARHGHVGCCLWSPPAPEPHKIVQTTPGRGLCSGAGSCPGHRGELQVDVGTTLPAWWSCRCACCDSVLQLGHCLWRLFL